ncbi:MAG: DUF554 domain-containing protein [Desulfobacterales bacterium]|nr:DUF554 domain-containing protein [Desulfobacterales bacterium]
MTGTIVNTIAIIVGSLLGFFSRKFVSEKSGKTIIQSISLAVILIGLKSAFKAPGDDLLLIIICLALGTVIGEILQIQGFLEKTGLHLEKKFSKSEGSIAKAFITASLVYCVGSMGIVGSMESGLSGNHQTLYAKALLDGISAIVFASSLGIGVIFSSIAVFLYQGTLTITVSFMKPYLVESVINQMTATGGLLIVAIGLNLLIDKEINVGNMLPAIFLPLVYYIGRQLIM